MRTRTQLKQDWSLKTVRTVDEIAIALYEETKSSYEDEEVANMYQVHQIMAAHKVSASDAVRMLSQFDENVDASTTEQDFTNQSFGGANQSFNGYQQQIAEELVPIVAETAIQTHETFYDMLGVMLNHPVVTGSDRVQSARGRFRAAIQAPITGKNGSVGLLSKAMSVVDQQPNRMLALTNGDLTPMSLPASTQ